MLAMRTVKKSVRKCTQRLSCMLGWDCCCGGASAFSNHSSASDSDGDEHDDENNRKHTSSGSTRFVEIDLLRPDLNAQRDFPDNSIRTAKYTLLSGVPLSLLYQFHKVSNIYFLVVMVISLVPGASPINPFSSIAPLCLVLGAGIIKDLWEDWKRRKADKAANEKIVHVLRGDGFEAVKSHEVQSGDVMLFRLGEEVKADCLILNTSLPDGLTYIETANLDGETNAKTRRAKIQTVELLGTVEDINEVALNHCGHMSSAAAAAAAPGGIRRITQKIGASGDCCGDREVGDGSGQPGDVHGGFCAREEGENGDDGDERDVDGIQAAALEKERELYLDNPAYYANNGSRRPAHQDTNNNISNTSSSHAIRGGGGGRDGDNSAAFRQSNREYGTSGSSLPNSRHHHRRGGSNLFPSGSVSQHNPQLSASLGASGAGVSGLHVHRAGHSADGAVERSGDDIDHENGNGDSDSRQLDGEYSGEPRTREEREAVLPHSYSSSSRHGSLFRLGRHRHARTASSGHATPPPLPPTSAVYHQRSYTTGAFPTLGHSSSTGNLERGAGLPPLSGLAHPHPLHHSRSCTLDERLERDGSLPVPSEILNMSRQYEASVREGKTTGGGGSGGTNTPRRLLHSLLTNPQSRSLQHQQQSSASLHYWEIGEDGSPGEAVDGNGRDGVSSGKDRGCDEEVVTPLTATSRLRGMGVDHHHHHHQQPQQGLDTPAGMEHGGVVILGSAPSPDLSSWYGQVRIAATGEMVAVGVDQFLPRGCIIRNTDWVLGATLYTGKNTKMLLNLRPKPNKTTRMTRRLNQLNIFLFILNQVLMLLLCGLAVWFTRKMRKPREGARSAWTHWYLEWNLHRYADVTLFWWRYLTNFVLLSYLIPMSLYVTLEFNKAMQMLMIAGDKRMAVFDEFAGKLKKSRPKTSELNCQLGQVEFIFTDKTGTLTENLMTYVGGFAAGIRHDEREKPGGLGKHFYRKASARAGGGGGGLEAEVSSTYSGGRGGVLSFDYTAGAGTSGASGVFPTSPSAPVFLQSATSLNNVVRTASQTGIPRVDSISLHADLSLRVANGGSGTYQMLTALVAPSQQHQHGQTPLALAAGSVLAQAIGRTNEAALETDDLYRYLRAMALCHSVVCFDDEEKEEAVREAEKDSNARKVRQAERKKKKRKAERCNRGTAERGREPTSSRHISPCPDELNSSGNADGARAAPANGRLSRMNTLNSSDHKSPHRNNHHRTGSRYSHHCSESLISREEAAVLRAELASLGRSSNQFFHVPNAVPAGPHDNEDGSGDRVRVRDRRRSSQRQTPSRSKVHHHHHHRHRNLSVNSHGKGNVSLVDDMAHSRTLSASRLLHGRTGSSSWYCNRYHTNATQHQPHQQTSTAGIGVGEGDFAAMEDYIDRSKLYEGQSLDEIALVSAARENGFTLFQRTAKQMFIKVFGKVLCYDIVAELEFTPQRKVMSILLHRNPSGDSEETASSAVAGGNTHYHRGQSGGNDHVVVSTTEEEEIVSTARSSREALLARDNSHNHHRDSPQQRAGVQHVALTLPGRAMHEPFASLPPPQPTTTTTTSTATRVPAKRSNDNFVRHLSLSSQSSEADNEDGPSVFAHSAGTLPRRQETVVCNGSTTDDFAQDQQQQQQQSHSADGARFIKTSNNNNSSLYSNAAVTAAAQGEWPYLLLVKGADSSMMEILNRRNPRNTALKPVFVEQLDEMASQGLRTLVLGQRYLTEAEVRQWLPVYNEAQCAMSQRSERLHEAYALLERDIDLVGSTAVEDKLQEGVPETLEFLSEAGIVVWMLTGDKRETAVTIALTSGLVDAQYENGVCHLDLADLIAEEAAAAAGEGGENQTATASDTHANRGDTISTNRDHSSHGNSRSNNNHFARTGSSSDDVMVVVSTTSSSDNVRAGNVNRNENGGGVPVTREVSSSPNGGKPYYTNMCHVLDAQLSEAERLCAASEEVHGGNLKTVVVVVDGKTLDFIFKDNERAHRFFLLGSRCRSAVCCRMTPLQKAQIVHMFQKNMHAVALAIGDGANDVSMIQESKIGIGIMGLEGSQAELASDYAIPKFRFLKRLLMVHGRFSIFRDAHCIVYSLYKNVVVTVGMMAYSFYSAYSGQAFMDSWLLAMFSIFFCSLQPLMIGILDKDVEDELAESLPQLYPPLSRENLYFSFPYIAKWIIDGCVEGALFFFFLIYTAARKDDMYRAKSGGVEDYGETFFTMLVLVVDLRVGVLVTYYMILFAIAIFAEIAILPVIQIIYSELHSLAGSNWCVYTAHALYGSSKFYLFLLFSVGVLVVYSISTSLYMQMFYPWQNAGLAMIAAKRSPYRRLHHQERKELTEEYKKRVTDLLDAEESAARQAMSAEGQQFQQQWSQRSTYEGQHGASRANNSVRQSLYGRGLMVVSEDGEEEMTDR